MIIDPKNFHSTAICSYVCIFEFTFQMGHFFNSTFIISTHSICEIPLLVLLPSATPYDVLVVESIKYLWLLLVVIISSSILTAAFLKLEK